MDGRSFVWGALAGGGLLAAGMLLGASGSSEQSVQRVAEFDTIIARRIDIVRPGGEVVMRLRTGKDGGVLHVLDRDERERVELAGDGSMSVISGDGKRLARLGSVETRRGWEGIDEGELLVFDRYGTVIGRMPGWITAREEVSEPPARLTSK